MVRAYSIQAIGRLVKPEGQRRTDLDRLLNRSLGDEYPLVRAIAGLEIIRLGRGEDASSVLSAIRKGEEGYETAQLSLGLLGSRTADAIRSLRLATRLDSDPWIKKAANQALGD
jgi:hypothetical protein